MTTDITDMTDAQVAEVYAKAHAAAAKLKKTTVKQRVHILEKLIDHVHANQDSIVQAIMDETKKTRTDALVSEIMGVLDNIEWTAHNAKKILADKKVHTPITLMGKKSYITHEAHGVVLVISPWNYPLHIGLSSIIAGFVTGNAVVFKPSEVTPLKQVFNDILACDPLLQESVFVCHGTGETAQKLIAAKPAKIFFTGSNRTGIRILQQAAPLLIPVDLELGGKDPAIVFDDVNIDRVAAGVAWGALTNGGQSCSSVERVYVHEKIFDQFAAKVTENVNALVVDYNDDGGADVGGITAGFQYDIIKNQVNDAIGKGANVLAGGTGDDERLLFQPTVLTGLTDDMELMTKETFGPVIPLQSFKDEDEAIALANASNFGLSASVWSKDLKRAERVAKALECGAVSINNVMLTEGNPALTFGGAKDSGYGRQKGEEGLLGYARSKSILVDKDSKKMEANWYPYTQTKYNNFKALIAALFNGGALKLVKFAVSGLKLEGHAQKPRDEA